MVGGCLENVLFCIQQEPEQVSACMLAKAKAMQHLYTSLTLKVAALPALEAESTACAVRNTVV